MENIFHAKEFQMIILIKDNEEYTIDTQILKVRNSNVGFKYKIVRLCDNEIMFECYNMRSLKEYVENNLIKLRLS